MYNKNTENLLESKIFASKRKDHSSLTKEKDSTFIEDLQL